MSSDGQQGVVTAHYGVAVDVLFYTDSVTRMIRVKRNSGHVVGDRVVVRGEHLERLERQSELSRMDARGNIHTVGANLDVLCITTSCEPLSPPDFIDRAVVAGRANRLQPVLVMNKSDLSCFADYYTATWPVYQQSMKTFAVSAVSGAGLEELIAFFHQNHRGIFVGPTGVGKSSILNSLLPDLNLQTGEICESKKRGRHTTTVSTLHRIPGGGELIDSPGFNDFGLVDISVPQLAKYFPGFEKALPRPCKFRDCKHREEPGCTVTEMVEENTIRYDRYTTYLQVLAEVEAIQSEPKYRERRHRRKKN
ncbi:MAG: ribosome small subunit-dependent GTPase A [Desulforhopalus sp.]